MMKKVRIIKDWGDPNIFRQTPEGKGIWGDLFFTFDEIKDCDALVVLNRPPKQVYGRCGIGQKYLLMQEPPIENYKWHRKSYRYFDKVNASWDKDHIGNMCRHQGALPWHINKSYDELKALTVQQCSSKLDRLSWVTSNASSRIGHRLRMDFLQFLRGQNFDFDLFGRGFNPVQDKFDALFPYKYSLAIESHSCNDYWTEKIADCFLSWTIPIYWGAKNIEKYFPKNSIILLNPDDFHKSAEKIQAAIDEDYWSKNIDSLREARENILEKYQFFPQIHDYISKTYKNKKNFFYIPGNKAHYEINSSTNIQKIVRLIPKPIREFLKSKITS